jgi:hypothetical protein
MDTFTNDVGTKLMFEDDRVSVWELKLAPGEATAWHQHLHDYMFVVVRNGRVRVEFLDGSFEEQDDVIGAVGIREKDLPHRLVNLSQNEYFNIVIELKG